MTLKNTILAAVMLALPLATGAAQAQTTASVGKITVTGEGSVNAAPDMATILVGVSTEGPTAGGALADNSALLAAVLAKLTEVGIEDRDIQTSGLSMVPQFTYDQSGVDQTPDITGYIVNNSLSVRVRALPTLGGVLDAMVQSGANSINGVSFGLIDPKPLMDQARSLAVADARRKAELLAVAAGGTLGPVLSINETSVYASPMPMPMFGGRDAAKSSVPVAEGEVGVTALVMVEFGFGG